MQTLTQLVSSEDHALGPPEASLVIVEYGDYDCPHTRAAHAKLRRLSDERGGDLRLIFRYFPLRHLHPLAEWLAERMELAHLQGKFWPLHERLMLEPRMARPIAERAMAGVGLDLDGLPEHIEAIRTRVEADVQRGKADGVRSTPSFFFNGRPHDGHYDIDTLREQVRVAVTPTP